NIFCLLVLLLVYGNRYQENGHVSIFRCRCRVNNYRLTTRCVATSSKQFAAHGLSVGFGSTTGTPYSAPALRRQRVDLECALRGVWDKNYVRRLERRLGHDLNVDVGPLGKMFHPVPAPLDGHEGAHQEYRVADRPWLLAVPQQQLAAGRKLSGE